MRRLHRLLLRAYPERHRRRFGREIELFFERGLAEARSEGRLAAVRFVARHVATTAWHGLAMRLVKDGRGRREGPPERRLEGGGDGMRWIEDVAGDVRVALRGLVARPGFAAVALVTLALGIGGTTAIFTLVNEVLLEPPPFEEADRVAWVMNEPRPGTSFIGLSDPFYLEIEAAVRERGPDGTGLESVGALAPASVNVGGTDRPERVPGERVTPSVFEVLGTPAALGRTFAPEEGRPGGEPVVVLSHALWTRRLGADPAAVGRTLRIGSEDVTVVGVMPADFEIFGDAELWLPLVLDPAGVDPSAAVNNNRAVIGRLAAGLDEADAEARLAAVASRVRERYPDVAEPEHGLGLQAYGEWAVGEVRPGLLILMGAVGLVLLIACANLANLLLVRNEGRQREMALRRALGAGRGRLIRQLLVEATVLGVMGAALGAGAAAVAVRVIASLVPPGLDLPAEPTLDGTVLLFALATGVGAALLFGILPALRSAGRHLRPGLAHGARAGRAGSGRLRGTLVVSEVGLATVLLTGAGLLLGSLLHLAAVDPGFEADGRWVGRVTLDERYDATAAADFHRRFVDRLEASPGVVAAAVGQWIPLQGRVNWGFTVRDQPDAGVRLADYSLVGPGYFETMDVPVTRGRAFRWADVDGPPAVVVSEAFAASVWPGLDPIGKRVRVSVDEPVWHEVVGVVGDVRNRSLTAEPAPVMYFPPVELSFAGPRSMGVVVRVADGGVPVGTLLRDALAELDPSIPGGEVRSMESLVAASEARRRFLFALLAGFASVAVALAAVGLYGVLSYAVSTRTRELGVRMALGADARRVRAMVLRQSGLLAGAGVIAGLAGAWALSRFLEAFLFGVERTDPLSYAGVAVLLSSVAALATWLPARRATSVDPAEALRSE